MTATRDKELYENLDAVYAKMVKSTYGDTSALEAIVREWCSRSGGEQFNLLNRWLRDHGMEEEA